VGFIKSYKPSLAMISQEQTPTRACLPLQRRAAPILLSVVTETETILLAQKTQQETVRQPGPDQGHQFLLATWFHFYTKINR
jgi:hypothetical protein